MKALVIGGSGPTGPSIVEGLRKRGYKVTVLSRGVHPYNHPADVEQIVGDPHFHEPLQAAIGDRTFDVVVACYGRLAVVADVLTGKTPHLIAAGGFALYRGWHDPAANWPSGMHVPVPEDAAIVTDPDENKFASKIAGAEARTFEKHPTATIFRYPYVYGPRQVTPREWSVVRRVLDGRRTIILINGGRTLSTHGYAENLAHALMLSVDKPEACAGKSYNCGDEIQLDQKQIVEIASKALGVDLEIVSIPNTEGADALTPFRSVEHRLMDLFNLKTDLGYRDVMHPVPAMERTFRWYLENPLERGGELESRIPDPFDYAAEDRAIEIARDFKARVAGIERETREFIHPYAHPKTASLGRDERGR